MLEMATKKLKLEVEEISEILVADTESESGAEVSDVEEEEEDDMTTLHATVRHLARRVEGLDTIYLWTISFHHQEFLMTWMDIK